MRGLNEYLKNIIILYEAMEHPAFQRFLEIDTKFSPNYEYESIDPYTNNPYPQKNTAQFPKLIQHVMFFRLRVIADVDDIELSDESEEKDQEEEEKKEEIQDHIIAGEDSLKSNKAASIAEKELVQ